MTLDRSSNVGKLVVDGRLLVAIRLILAAIPVM